MPRPRHTKIYEGMQEKIKATAWELMAEVGAAGISMREIGRRMGMSAPALYNYYANQDDLMTALVLDAFNGLADAMETAEQTTQDSSFKAQFIAVAQAYRQWAQENRTRYYLIYGTPIMGYEAPREVTVPAAVRIFAVLTRRIELALQAGKLVPTALYEHVPFKQMPILQALIDDNQYPVSMNAVYLGFKCWVHLYGLVMPALLGHLVPLDTDEFFRTEIEELCILLGFRT